MQRTRKVYLKTLICATHLLDSSPHSPAKGLSKTDYSRYTTSTNAILHRKTHQFKPTQPLSNAQRA